MDLDDLTARVESVSRHYATKFGITRDATWFLLKLQEEVGELTQAHLAMTGQTRPKGQTEKELTDAFHQELADVLGHTLLLAHHHQINLTEIITKKWLNREHLLTEPPRDNPT